MRAVWLTGFGDPEVLVEKETPDPVPAADQVVIDVAAASIVFIDTLVRSGRVPAPGGGLEPPYVPGNGVAGTVAEVGSAVDVDWLGRRVVATTGGSGGYAQRVAVAVENLIPVPAGVELRDAAALLADGRTATGVAEYAAPQPGEWVLVEAAAGGVGSLLVQLCRSAGARVVAAVGGDAKRAVAERLGAEASVDYSREGWAAEVRSIAGDLDVVFDGVGGEIGATALSLLRPGGRFVLFGLASGGPTTATRDDITLLGFETLGAVGRRASEFTAKALAEAAAGRLRPLIGQTFPLAEAAAAHAAIGSRRTTGKTLLIP